MWSLNYVFALPVHYGGLGIADPVKSAPIAARVSREGVAVLVNTILGRNVLCVTDHLAHIDKVISEARRHREEQFKITSSSLLTKLPPLACRSVQRAIDFGTSGWLTTRLPTITLICLLSNFEMHCVRVTIGHCLCCLPHVMGVGKYLVCLML